MLFYVLLIMIEPLNLPPYAASLRRSRDRVLILDTLRRRYVALTPEEWVRQHFVHYLTDHLGYPAMLMQNEVELRCGDKRLRCDSVLYDRDGSAVAIIEYKAPSVALTQEVVEQIAAYNMLLHVDYLMLSNGMVHCCFKMDYENHCIVPMAQIPAYENLAL